MDNKKIKQAGVVDPVLDAMLDQSRAELDQLRSLVDGLKSLAPEA